MRTKGESFFSRRNKKWTWLTKHHGAEINKYILQKNILIPQLPNKTGMQTST